MYHRDGYANRRRSPRSREHALSLPLYRRKYLLHISIHFKAQRRDHSTASCGMHAQIYSFAFVRTIPLFLFLFFFLSLFLFLFLLRTRTRTRPREYKHRAGDTNAFLGFDAESVLITSQYLCCSVLQSVVVCCGVLQCVAVCCSVLQCIVDEEPVLITRQYL